MTAESRFTLYDLIVDLIPGVVTILLFFWIFGTTRIRELVQVYGTALPAVALLAVGYVVGRVIHAISNIDIVEKIGVGIYNWIPVFGDLEPRDRRFSNRLAYLMNDVEDETLEKAVSEAAIESILGEVDDGPTDLNIADDPGDTEGFTRGAIGDIPDLRYARYLSDTLSYRDQSLSWKYGILATFFRNMWLILIMAAFTYLTNQVSDLDLTSVAIFAGLLFSGVICLQQRFKFKRRQIRTMINEIALSTG
jgi:hypothetical protein